MIKKSRDKIIQININSPKRPTDFTSVLMIPFEKPIQVISAEVEERSSTLLATLKCSFYEAQVQLWSNALPIATNDS